MMPVVVFLVELVALPSELLNCVSCATMLAVDGYAPPCSLWYISTACRSSVRSPDTALSAAPAAPRLIFGIAIAAMIPMITTTTTNSIKLNARRARLRLPAMALSFTRGIIFCLHEKQSSPQKDDLRHLEKLE